MESRRSFPPCGVVENGELRRLWCLGDGTIEHFAPDQTGVAKLASAAASAVHVLDAAVHVRAVRCIGYEFDAELR